MLKKIVILVLMSATAFATELNRVPVIIDSTASFYAPRFEGRKCANGEIFRQSKYTAAYNSLPLNTQVIVTRIIEGDTYKVQVKINDRTAKRFSHRIDLSTSAAKQIHLDKEGIAPVTIEIL